MVAILKFRDRWRVAALLLLLIAFIAPWGIDQINVPAQYACQEPWVRLEGDFCGLPRSGILLPLWAIVELFRLPWMLLVGELTTGDGLRQFSYRLLDLLLVLPLFTTLRLTLRTDRGCRQALNLLGWGLAAAAGLAFLYLMTQSGFPNWLGMLWGRWLHLALAMGMLALELLAIVAGRGHDHVH